LNRAQTRENAGASGGHLVDGPPPPQGAVFNRRMARVSALAALAVIFFGVAYSRESGFLLYALLLAIPSVAFGLARASRKWQAWGWVIAWVMLAFDLAQTVFTTLNFARRVHRSDIVVLVFLMALLLTLVAQLVFVRRAFCGRIAFGTPLLRATLYYVCLLLVAGATLPSWYVPPIVRRENKAVDNLHKLSAAMESYARASKYVSYPAELSALGGGGMIAPSNMLDPELMCAQSSCIKNGYRFEYHPVFKEGRIDSFTISARPLEFEETGNDSFLLAEGGKIYQTREDRDALRTDGRR
jgi:hypothetical protein